MATGTVQFQSATLATPIAGLAVMADAVNDADHGAGTTQYIKVMDGATGGTAKAGVTDANGLAVDVTRVQGTIQALGTVQTHGTSQILGTVQAHGTSQALGTFQPLAGSVHLASGTVQVLGTIQAHGTTQALGTFQPLAGSVHLASGTVQVLGSVQTVGTSQVLGSVQTVGTSQVIGTVQSHGTSQVLGTTQPLAGSVHLAAGSVNAQGVIGHGAAIAGNPLLWGGFGSSGTQAAVSDGQLVRAWLDLNGRQIVKGTVESVLGTVQVLGSVQTVGTSQVLGTVQTHGTSQVLGTTQPLAGSVHVANTAAITGTASVQGLTPYLSGGGSANPVLGGGISLAARPGTSTIGSVVRNWYDLHGRQVIQVGNGTTAVLGTYYVANGNGTLLPAIGAGSFVRIYDIVVSGSAAGTVRILNDTTQIWGPLHLAANGGWNMNSAVGFKFAANTSFTVVNGMGSLSVTINYGVEGA